MAKSSNDPLLLIDADVLVYQACAGAEKVICWEEEICFPVCGLTDAFAAFEYKLEFIQDTLQSSNVLLCFSDNAGNNFRKALWHQYKMNRVDKPRPVALKFLREQLEMDESFTCKSVPTLEADDVMGIIATHSAANNPIVVTIDKDLKSIPCRFFNIGHPDDGVQEISREQADYWFMMQALMGDSTDGYAGCPKYGIATAAKLFQKRMAEVLSDATNEGTDTVGMLWPAVVEAYKKAGFGEEYALTMARLARILRAEDWDFKEQKVKLWTHGNY